MGVGAAVATAVGLTAGTTAYIVTAAVVNIAVSIGTTLLSQASIDTPSQAPAKDPGRKGNIRSTTEPHHIVFGRVRKGGVICYLNGTGDDNTYLHRVVVFAAHEIEAFDAFNFDGENLLIDAAGAPAGTLKNFVRILPMAGAATQEAIPELVAENPNWTEDHRLRGRAYSYDRLKYDSSKFPSFIPAITATMRGKKDIYDPRSAATAYTTNPALMVAHILEEYLDVPRARIDEATLIASANICDELVNELSGGTSKRYQADGWFLLEGEPAEWYRGPLAAMAGALVEHAGTYYIHAGAWAAAVATITDDDLVGGIRFTTAASDSARSNVVTGTFVGAAGYDQPAEFPPYKLASAIAEDGGVERAMSLDLEWISSPAQAQRVAKIALMENRLDEMVEVEVTFEKGRSLRPFQTITFDSDAMGISGTFRIRDHSIRMSEQGLVVALVLKEHAAEVYDWDYLTEEQEYESPSGDSWREDQVTITDFDVFGNASAATHNPGRIEIVWQWDYEATLVEVEFEATCRYEYRPTSGDPWGDPQELEVAATATTSPTTIQFVDAGQSGGLFRNVAFVQLRARAVLENGEFGPWLTLNAETLSLPPQFFSDYYNNDGFCTVGFRKNPSSPTGTVVRWEVGASAVVTETSPAITGDSQYPVGSLRLIGTKMRARAWEPGKAPSDTKTWTVVNNNPVWRD